MKIPGKAVLAHRMLLDFPFAVGVEQGREVVDQFLDFLAAVGVADAAAARVAQDDLGAGIHVGFLGHRFLRRFERLVRSEADDLSRALRRALALTDGGCNVASLGRDVLNWDGERGDDIRRTWYFDYFNAGRPAQSDAAEDVSQ